MNDDDVRELAEGFVAEYLEETPVYLDVSEYVTDNAEGDIEEITQDDVDKVFKAAADLLDTMAQVFAERVSGK